jgi:enamine deaminase RidA (YjgF/YER057c/UK114 family)
MDMMCDEDPEAELPAILGAVSRELSALGDMGADLQSVLSPLAHAHGNLRQLSGEVGHVPGSEEIQALDLFTQRLFVLADFLTALASTVSPGSRADLRRALSVVSLSDVARRLGSLAATEEMAVDTGALELFGDEP